MVDAHDRAGPPVPGRLTRFDEFQSRLGIARNVLTTRLNHLVDHGVVEKVAYQDNPVRYDYRLTEKGKDLWLAMTVLGEWGDQWAASRRPFAPRLLRRRRAPAARPAGRRSSAASAASAIQVDQHVPAGLHGLDPLRACRAGSRTARPSR